MRLNLIPKKKAKLFDALAEDGKHHHAVVRYVLGAYNGSCVDKYGVQWMVNVNNY